MIRRTGAVLLAFGVLSTVVAYSQTVPNPTQQSIDVSPGPVPVFRITVVARTTPAINYRPRRGDTKIDFVGTALLPQARGSATISGEQGYMKIQARFDKLASASRFGREYLTYVLWAITPEGRATNLGEVQVDDDDAKVEVTTELQAFGLVVTAEPYFAVTQPSDVVVIENVIRDDTKGSFEVIQANYELLRRGSYLMNQDAARLNLKPLEPGAPLDLAQARNAVELARLAGADQFAADSFNKAAGLLATAEEARTARRGGNAIMMPARQAAQTAEDARLVGLRRQEEAFQATQRAAALGRENDALDRAQTETARRRQAELATQTATAGRIVAERARATDADVARAQAEAARLAADRTRATDADAARVAADTARAEAETARVAAERDRSTDADAARVAAEAARTQSEAARLEVERDRATEADAARLAAEAARTQAESARLAADRARATDADAARVAVDGARAEAEAARLTAERARAADADAARVAADAARAQAEAARVAAESRAQGAARSAAAQSEQEKAALREQLRGQLNVVLDTRETARGLIVNLSDVLFDTGSSSLKPGAREKLARVSGILGSHQGLRLDIEGHTDSVGGEDYNQRLSERRGESVRAYLVQQGIASAAVGSAGLGETKPVATNDTTTGRQQNRRVELVVSGDVIGTR